MSDRYVRILSHLDPPVIFDASVTPIPASGSLPLQVVASLSAIVYYVKVLDGIGQYVGLYIGPPGSEVRKCILGGGGTDSYAVFLPKGSRVSLRSETTSAITTGTLSCAFLGDT